MDQRRRMRDRANPETGRPPLEYELKIITYAKKLVFD
jgi:hypothetical protein